MTEFQATKDDDGSVGVIMSIDADDMAKRFSDEDLGALFALQARGDALPDYLRVVIQMAITQTGAPGWTNMESLQ